MRPTFAEMLEFQQVEDELTSLRQRQIDARRRLSQVHSDDEPLQQQLDEIDADCEINAEFQEFSSLTDTQLLAESGIFLNLIFFLLFFRFIFYI